MATRVVQTYIWPKKDPFELLNKTAARAELLKLLMEHGEGMFFMHESFFQDDTAEAAVLNGLQCRGFLSCTLDYARGAYAFRITQRGLDFLKEEA